MDLEYLKLINLKKQMINFDRIKLLPINESYQLFNKSIQNFTCGNSLIDSYLKVSSNALRDHDFGVTSTTTIIYNDQIIGFFTANCSSLEIPIHEARAVGLTEDLIIPAIEVKYLSIRSDFKNNGIGTFILQYIIGNVLNITPIFTCRYIFIWSVEDKISFYEKRFFSLTGKEENGLYLMRLLIPTYHIENA